MAQSRKQIEQVEEASRMIYDHTTNTGYVWEHNTILDIGFSTKHGVYNISKDKGTGVGAGLSKREAGDGWTPGHGNGNGYNTGLGSSYTWIGI
jgi:hypothetical protein